MALTAAFIPRIALSQEPSNSLISPEQTSQIAVAMLDGYRLGNVNQMLKDESDCWEDSARRKVVDKRIVAGCTSAAVAGGLIEATYARSQRRAIHPNYAAQVLKERIKANSRLDEAETQGVMRGINVDAILLALAGAGLQ